MTKLFDNQVAIVSGAAQGIGEAIARGLGAAGCRVAFVDIESEGAQRAASAAGGKDRCRAFMLDVRDEAACRAVVAQIRQAWGPVAVLINNAGVTSRSKLEDDDIGAALDRTFAVNVKGLLNLTRACLADLKETRGAIVNLASITSLIATYASIPYASSKGAVGQMTKFLARDLGSFGVRVNAVAPGYVRTPLTADLEGDTARLSRTIDRTLLKRVAEPGDVVGPVVFLASPMARYITGHILPVDGGYTAN